MDFFFFFFFFDVFLKLIELWPNCLIILHQLKHFQGQIHIVILYSISFAVVISLPTSTKFLNNDFAATDSLSHWSLPQQGSL